MLFIGLLIAYIGSVDFLPCFGVVIYPFGYLPILIFTLVQVYAIQVYAIVKHTGITYHEIINHMDDGVIVINRSGRITTVNPFAERITGIGSSDLLGKDIIEAFSSSVHELEDPGQVMKLIDRIKIDPLQTIDEEIVYSKPATCINITSTPVKDMFGDISGIIIMLRDITERKRAEAQLLKAKKAADAAGRELKDVNTQLE